MGPPEKPKGFDGGELEGYFREGKMKEVADYCEIDVVGTYQVWLRYELFRGTLSQDAFERSQQNLADFPDNEQKIATRQFAPKNGQKPKPRRWPAYTSSAHRKGQKPSPRGGVVFSIWPWGAGPPEIPNAKHRKRPAPASARAAA